MSKKINPIVEELLDSNEIPEEFETPEDLLEGIANMTSEVAEIKQEVEDVKVSGDPITDIKIFNEVSDLINRAVAVLDTCKEDIERSSLLDAELVSAYAKLISSTREIISDNIASLILVKEITKTLFVFSGCDDATFTKVKSKINNIF